MTTGTGERAKVSEAGGPKDIADLLQAISPLLGSGKTTTKVSSDPGQTDELIKQIMASVSPENLDLMQQNVLDRAKQTIAPTNIGGVAAGLRGYSDTTRIQVQNEAVARASAEAMAVRMDAINKANLAAGRLTEARMQNNRQQESQTSENTAGKILKYATPLALLYHKMGGKLNFPNFNGSEGDAPASASNNEIIPGSGDSNIFSVNDATDISSAPVAGAADTAQSFGGDVTSPDQGLGDEPIPEVTSGDDVDTQNLTDLESGDTPPVEDVPLEDLGDGINFEHGGIVRAYADGTANVKPGARPIPASYTAEAVEESAARSRKPSPPALATSNFNPNPVSRTGKTKTLPGGGTSGGDSGDGSTNSQSLDTTDTESGAFQGHVSNTALALAGLNALSGNLPGAIMSLAKGLAISDLGASLAGMNSPDLGQAYSAAQQSQDATLGMLGLSPSITDAPTDIGEALGGMTTSGATLAGGDPDAPSAMNSDQDAGVDLGLGELGVGDGPAGAPGSIGIGATAQSNDAGDSSGAPGGQGDGAGFGGGGSSGASGAGSGDGGSDGGGYEEGTEDVKAKNDYEASGIDRVLAHLTPGEAVLPVDTVQVLGEDTIEALIRATHNPRRKAQMRKAA